MNVQSTAIGVIDGSIWNGIAIRVRSQGVVAGESVLWASWWAPLVVALQCNPSVANRKGSRTVDLKGNELVGQLDGCIDAWVGTWVSHRLLSCG
jgi:hypothetical protein